MKKINTVDTCKMSFFFFFSLEVVGFTFSIMHFKARKTIEKLKNIIIYRKIIEKFLTICIKRASVSDSWIVFGSRISKGCTSRIRIGLPNNVSIFSEGYLKKSRHSVHQNPSFGTDLIWKSGPYLGKKKKSYFHLWVNNFS